MLPISNDNALSPASGLRWLYVDFNSYFASVEQQLRPELRGKPVAVVPVETDATCAIAASYEAKAFGVRTGTPIWEAKKICPGIITIGTYYYDEVRKSVVLFYDFEPEREAVFKALLDAFELMMVCKGSWHTDAQGNVRDRKYHAGAGTVIKRSAIRFVTGQPPFVKTNIDVPVIPAGKQTLYFFPDRLLVFQKNAIGAVGYNDLNIAISPSKFVEDGPVPGDAEIVGRTWRYVNKNGGPDRRFNNNRELPIALYEEVRLQSSNGLNEIITLSKRDATKKFSDSINNLLLSR